MDAGGYGLFSLPGTPRPDEVDEAAQGQQVAVAPETCNLPDADRRHYRVAAERFPGMHIRKVDFHRREPHCRQCVPHGQTVVSKGPGVDNHTLGPAGGIVQGVDDCAFVIRLFDPEFDTELPRNGSQAGVDVGKRPGAVHLGLAPSQQVEIGTVNDQNS